MNDSMNSTMWKATHRFGSVLLGLLLLFGAWEMGHAEDSSMFYRVGGAGALGLLGLLALLKSLRGAPPEETPRSVRGRARS